MINIIKWNDFNYEDDYNKYVLINKNNSEFIIEEKSIINGINNFSKKISNRFYEYNDVTDIFRSCVVNNIESLSNAYNNLIPIMKNYLDEAKLMEFCIEVIDYAIYYKTYKCLKSSYNGIDSPKLKKYLNLLDIDTFIMQTPEIWELDNNDNPNLEITLKKYKFIFNNDKSLINDEAILIKNFLLNRLRKHMDGNNIHEIYKSEFKVDSTYENIRIADSLFDVCYTNLINDIISLDHENKPKPCKTCHEYFFPPHHSNSYCSDTCKKEAKKKSQNKFNHSTKGKKRTKNFFNNKKKKHQ